MKRGRSFAVLLTAAVAALAPASAGAAVTTFGTTGAQFGGIAVGPDGHVYVTTDVIREYDSSGDFVRDIGTVGTGDGQFDRPIDVTIDAGGNIYVFDQGTTKAGLQKFAPDGTFLTKHDSTGQYELRDLAASPDGTIWGVGNNDSSVRDFEPVNLIEVHNLNSTDTPTWGSRFAVEDLTVDQLGNPIAWRTTSFDTLERFDPSGADIGTITGPLPSPGPGCCGTLDVGTDPGGSVLVAGLGSIVRFDAEGHLLGRYDQPGTRFRGIAGNADGIVFATAITPGDGSCPCTRNVFRIDTVTPEAALTATPNPAVTGQDVTFDASGSHVPLSSVVKYEWDFDGDGSFETDTGANPAPTRRFADRGTHTVRVRTTSAGGGTATAEIVADVRPAPPSGPVGVTINGGAQFTNDPQVVLSPIWPALASTATVSNDGGFANAQVFPLQPALDWTLESSGPLRLPKTVYLRYGDSTQTFQDDIILDPVAPEIESATAVGPRSVAGASAAAARRYTVRTSARDDNSGLAGMQLTRDRSHPGALRSFRRTLRKGSPPKYVRVRDRAANFSHWRRVALLDVRPASRRPHAGRPLAIRYGATRPATLSVKLIRGTHLAGKASFEVRRGRGKVRIATRGIAPGRYVLRSRLQGVTFESRVTLRR